MANIAPSLQALRKQQNTLADGVFIYRLMFAVRFAEFHQRRLNGELQDAAIDLVSMLRDDIAPKSWWAVVLSDSVDLLQHGQFRNFMIKAPSLTSAPVDRRGNVVHIRGRVPSPPQA